jgi:hypothetical protein
MIFRTEAIALGERTTERNECAERERGKREEIKGKKRSLSVGRLSSLLSLSVLFALLAVDRPSKRATLYQVPFFLCRRRRKNG